MKIMVSCWVVYVALASMVVLTTGLNSTYRIPEVMFEVLRNGGFRAYILAPESATSVSIFININTPLGVTGAINIDCRTDTCHNGYFVVESKSITNKNDFLYYFVVFYPFNPTREGMILFWQVKELLDSYSIILDDLVANCDDLLLDDAFYNNGINLDNWIVEHKIPTYTGPRFLFNSYVNTPETIFFKSGTLHLKPIALTNENDVRGTLNFSSSCTSNIPEECVYTQQSTFLLPPVKSAMLRSTRKFRYGKFMIGAKLPIGDWIIPIIQLARPTTDHVSVDELWIAFTRGNYNLETQILYAGPVNNADEPLRSRKLVSYKLNSSFSDGFHTFKLNWCPDKLQFGVDKEIFGEINSQLGSFGASGSNLEYELQIGVGIGGLIDFSEEYSNKPWNNTERNYMKKFFEDRFNWLKTWNGDDTALKIKHVQVSAVCDDL